MTQVALRLLAIASLASPGLACSSSASEPRGGDGGRGTVDAHPGEGGPRADARPDRQAQVDAAESRDSRPPDVRAVPDGAGRDATRPASDAGPGDAAPDAPAATTLSLSLPLVPAFSPSIYDYYVQCPAATNPVVVTMTAAPGSTVALMQPETTPPAVENRVSVTVDAGAAIVVDVTSEGGTEQYWVRCLPPEFPAMDWQPHVEAGAPTPGYYLIGSAVPPMTAGGYAMVLDGNGVPVWFQEPAVGGGVYDVESLLPGTISFVPTLRETSRSAPREFRLDDVTAGVTSYVAAVGGLVNYHELRALPNGDYLVLVAPVIIGVDLAGLGTFGASEDILGCEVEEISPAGALVWDWDLTHHFDAVQDSTYPQAADGAGTLLVDPFHCNSIDVAPDGDLLVSARNMDSVFLVSRATGAVLWKMGGATYSVDNAPYISVVGDPLTSFYRQHDARFLPDGTVSMFDDQTGTPGPARAVIYSYDLTSGTASMVWQYESATSSEDMGSFRVLADGSRIIGWGVALTPQPAFSEVTEGGGDLLDFSLTDSNFTYRAVKVPVSAFDIGVLRATAGAAPSGG